MNTASSVRFAQLRDGVHWDAVLAGLAPDDTGALSLRRVPAPPADQPVRVTVPPVVAVSGIASDACGRVLLTDAITRTVVFDWPACSRRYVQPLDGGAIARAAPGGAAIHGDHLFVADSSSGSVLVLALPSLELRRIIGAGLLAPTRLSVDDEGRLYVVDSLARSLRRFSVDGTPDAVFDAAVAAHGLADPFDAIWVSGLGLLVSDAATDRVFALDGAGQPQGALTLPVSTEAIVPRCLAAYDGLILVSDSASGQLIAVDVPSLSAIGVVPDWRAPVSAMTFDANGDLLVKTDGGAAYSRLAAGGGCVASGRLTVGPVDAGVEVNWERVAVDAELPHGTDVVVETYVAAAASPPPSSAAWSRLPGRDAIFARADGPDPAAPGERRFLWVRLTARASGRESPVVADVHAHTTETSYLGQLPRVYARDDAKTRFLERLLALARSEFDDWDSAVDGMFLRLDPARAPAADLPWLQAALGLTTPTAAPLAAQRTLLARLPELYARRGTVAGLRDAVEIAAGVRPLIIEAFRTRRTWTLGEASLLGVDTALAPAAAGGLIVPGHVRTDPAYRGLAGEYYAGLEFDRAVMRRTDKTISFDATDSVAPEEGGAPLDRFSVRWSGQIKPRFSEIYTFYFTPAAGVRLWVDGVLLIDTWTESLSGAAGARLPLDADRWSAITCEMHRVVDPLDPADVMRAAEASLEWSSRSESRAIVPEQCLYSVADDRADLEPPPTGTDVGQAIVGASGPARPGDFGEALFADDAHLFTVVVPAAQLTPGRRQAVREAIDAEKPAHTDYHLCFPDARLRVGFQARLGIDAIVAGGPAPLRLGETSLDRDSVLGDRAGGGARVGGRARLGRDTIIR